MKVYPELKGEMLKMTSPPPKTKTKTPHTNSLNPIQVSRLGKSLKVVA